MALPRLYSSHVKNVSSGVPAFGNHVFLPHFVETRGHGVMAYYKTYLNMCLLITVPVCASSVQVVSKRLMKAVMAYEALLFSLCLLWEWATLALFGILPLLYHRDGGMVQSLRDTWD